jgi:hypothetical protein
VQSEDAVARTDLVTDERRLLRRARLAGRSDVRLASKHPEVGRVLFSGYTEGSQIHRLAARAVSSLPLVAGLARPLRALLTVVDLVRPRGWLADRIWYTARTLRYWQGVVEAGGPVEPSASTRRPPPGSG